MKESHIISSGSQLRDFFENSVIWADLVREWESWKLDIEAELRKIDNEHYVDVALKGNLETLEKVISTPHYMLQDFETIEEKGEKNGASE